jgi:hypothetical protein
MKSDWLKPKVTRFLLLAGTFLSGILPAFAVAMLVREDWAIYLSMGWMALVSFGYIVVCWRQGFLERTSPGYLQFRFVFWVMAIFLMSYYFILISLARV